VIRIETEALTIAIPAFYPVSLKPLNIHTDVYLSNKSGGYSL